MIPKGAKDAHQEYRLKSGSGLRLIQRVTIQLRLPGLVVRRGGQCERVTMNPVIDSLVQRGVAGAGVDGHRNVLGSWIRLSEQSSF